ncbi:hypothetical protein ABVT39_009581 [Epinephelus coioides]
MQRTGGGPADTQTLSELDQHIGAVIRETALSGVPLTECLDTDLGSEATLSSPPCAAATPEESEDEVLQSQPATEPEPSCSSTSTRTQPRASLHLISEAVLDSQERIGDTLDKIASTLATMSSTLKEINEN